MPHHAGEHPPHRERPCQPQDADRHQGPGHHVGQQALQRSAGLHVAPNQQGGAVGQREAAQPRQAGLPVMPGRQLVNDALLHHGRRPGREAAAQALARLVEHEVNGVVIGIAGQAGLDVRQQRRVAAILPPLEQHLRVGADDGVHLGVQQADRGPPQEQHQRQHGGGEQPGIGQRQAGACGAEQPAQPSGRPHRAYSPRSM